MQQERGWRESQGVGVAGLLSVQIRSWVAGIGRFARREPAGFIGLLIVVIWVVAAAFANLISPADPAQIHPTRILTGPRLATPFGSDELGRDVLSRVIFGARIALQVGLIAVGIGCILGGLIGLVAGFLGGRLDLFVQRTMDMLMVLPSLVLALALVAVLGGSLANVGLAVGITIIPPTSRVMRSAVLAVKGATFVEAAVSLGAGKPRIIVQHVAINVLAPFLVLVAFQLPRAILIEASLSFLGLGVAPPTPSWGSMLSRGALLYMESAPWLVIFPAVALATVIYGVNLLGDAVRDYLDPRLRTSKGAVRMHRAMTA